jgi:hypothetical protein
VPVTLESSDELSIIRLDATVDIACAAELKTSLVQALASGKDVHVSLDSATDLDVTAVQLLWAARREATASGVGFLLLDPVPEPLTSALFRAGFEDLTATANAGQVIEVIPCRP